MRPGRTTRSDSAAARNGSPFDLLEHLIRDQVVEAVVGELQIQQVMFRIVGFDYFASGKVQALDKLA